MNNAIAKLIKELESSKINQNRKKLLLPLREYLADKIKQKKEVNLNFICTHNSRRSQLSQVWAKVIADFYSLDINTFSGGIEITACNERTIHSFERLGFSINKPRGKNPHYELKYKSDKTPLILFSKIYNEVPNPKNNFAAVMACTHAEENCPFIPGAEKIISLPFEDPKDFDDTSEEAEQYEKCSLQIATEMKYVFNELLP